MAGEKASGTRLADKRVIRLFAIGQLGWAILSGIVSNWLVYFYMPSDTMLSRGMAVFITQGAVFAGLTVIGIITGCGRLLDGFIDPFIASQSDRPSWPPNPVHARCRHPLWRDDGPRLCAAGYGQRDPE